MRFENHHEATKVFPSHPRFLFPASPQQASDSLPRAAAQGRSPLPPHASLTSQPGVLPPELFLLRCRHVLEEQVCGFMLAAGRERVDHEPDSYFYWRFCLAYTRGKVELIGFWWYW